MLLLDRASADNSRQLLSWFECFCCETVVWICSMASSMQRTGRSGLLIAPCHEPTGPRRHAALHVAKAVPLVAPRPIARSSLKSRANLLRNYDSFLCAHPYMSISRRKPHWSRKPARSPPPRPHSGILVCRAFVSTVRFQLRTVHESSSASVSGRPLCKAASPSRTPKRQNVPLRGSLDPPPTSSKAKVARFLAFPRTSRTCHKKKCWSYGLKLPGFRCMLGHNLLELLL